MKRTIKENIYKILYVVSILLVVGFTIRFGVDIFRYDSYNSSAPLYAYALVRTVEFIVPSIICFVVALIVRKRHKKD